MQESVGEEKPGVLLYYYLFFMIEINGWVRH